MCGPAVYAGIFLAIAAFWPLGMMESRFFFVIAVLNTALFLFAFYSCSTSSCSYVDGMQIVSASQMTGCANITIWVVTPVLLYVYIASVFISLIGLIKGKEWTHKRWERLIHYFYKRIPFR